VPVWYVVQAAFAYGGGELAALIFRPRAGELLANTVLLVVLVVPCTVVLGVGGAWLVERTTLPGARVFVILLAAPLAVPAFVSSYAWGGSMPFVRGLGGGVFIAVLAYTPFVYLPVLAVLRGLDPAWEETARSLGHGPWRAFFRVVLPQLRLAASGGALVVGLHLLAEFGAFAFIRFETFTTAIVVAFQSTFAGPNAAALGVVLTGLTVVLLALEGAVRGRGRYARVGSGSPRAATRLPLGRATVPAVAALVVFAVAAVGVPLVMVLRWLLAAGGLDVATLVSAAVSTAALSTAGAVAAVAVALPIAWLSVRFPTRASRLLEGTAYLAGSLPAIIVALAVVTVSIRLVPVLYQTPVTVIAAYVIVFLPRALVTLRAGIAQVPVGLEEAAQALGVSPMRARARVTLPLLLPALGAAGALVALGAANELTATLLLAPTGTRTVATQFWAEASAVDYPAAAPYALVLVLLSIPAVIIMFAEATRGRSVR
jgi:iron(III) transport system permease protein